VVGCLLVVLFTVAIHALSALFLMLAWNLVMPSVFNLVELNYLQAFGLSVLLGFLSFTARSIFWAHK
jgi:hypothetical protein